MTIYIKKKKILKIVKIKYSFRSFFFLWHWSFYSGMKCLEIYFLFFNCHYVTMSRTLRFLLFLFVFLRSVLLLIRFSLFFSLRFFTCSFFGYHSLLFTLLYIFYKFHFWPNLFISLLLLSLHIIFRYLLYFTH